MYEKPNMPLVAKQYIQVPLSIIEDKNLSPNDFRVLCALKSHKPSYPIYFNGGLDHQTGLSRQTVSRITKDLKEKGYIKAISLIDQDSIRQHRNNNHPAGVLVDLNLEKWIIPTGSRYAELANDLCRYNEISPVEFRILAWLRAQNGIQAKPYTIRAALGIMQPVVVEALERLFANELIEIDKMLEIGSAKVLLAKKRERHKGRLYINDSKIQRIVTREGEWERKPIYGRPVIDDRDILELTQEELYVRLDA